MVMARWRRPAAVRAGSRRLRCAMVASTPACCNCRSSSCVCMYSYIGVYVCNAHTRAHTYTAYTEHMDVCRHACVHTRKMHSKKSPTAGSCLSYTQKRRPQLLGHTRKTTHQNLAIHARIHARIRTRSSSTAGAGTSSLPPASCSGACANPRGVQLRIIAVTDSAGGALPASVSGAASVWEVS